VSKRSLAPWSPRTSGPARSPISTVGVATQGRATSASTGRPTSQPWRSEERGLALPRAHRAPSPISRPGLQGTHRSASEKHLQAYLHEFVFRHNRRRTPMAALQTLLGFPKAQMRRPPGAPGGLRCISREALERGPLLVDDLRKDVGLSNS
jgi:hypothetical protein